MSAQSVTDPNTPIREILKAAGSEGIVLESEDHVSYAVIPLDDEVLDLLIDAVQSSAPIAARFAGACTLASSRRMRRSSGDW